MKKIIFVIILLTIGLNVDAQFTNRLEQDSSIFFNTIIKKYNPQYLGKSFNDIQYLRISNDTMKSLPKGIKYCNNLVSISFVSCDSLDWFQTFDLLKTTNLLGLDIYDTNLGGKLSENFYDLISLSAIGLRKCNLDTIDVNFCKFTQLGTLGLDSNNIANLPKELSQLKWLQHLSLEGNTNINIEQIIEVLKDNHHLTTLNLRNCEIQNMPESILELPLPDIGFGHLFIKGNPFVKNYDNLCLFSKIKNFGLLDILNSLRVLPNCFDTPQFNDFAKKELGLFCSIKYTSVDSIDYYLDNQPDFLKRYAPLAYSFDAVKQFNRALSETEFIEHKESIEKCVSLERINLVTMDKRAEEIIKSLSEFDSLKEVTFLNSRISENIGYLKQVIALSFIATSSRSLPKSINKTNIKYLSLKLSTNLDIKNIARTLSGNSTLEILDFNGTQITYLPEEFCSIKFLKSINLSIPQYSIRKWSLEKLEERNKIPKNKKLLFTYPSCSIGNDKKINVLGIF